MDDVKRGDRMKRNKSLMLYYGLKTVLLSALVIIGISFENARGSRLYFLIAYFSIYIAMGYFREKTTKNRNTLCTISFIIDIALVYGMESNSKYLINYLYHPFYVIIMAEAAFLLKKNGLKIGILSAGISSIKFIQWIYYYRDFTNISATLFHFLIMAFVLSMISFSNYYQREKKKQELLYIELLNTHKKLKDFSNKVEELSRIEERNHIARELHDTLGHQMTALIMMLEICSEEAGKGTKEKTKILEEAKTAAREGLTKIREVVETLQPIRQQKNLLSIEEMIEIFKKRTGIAISFDTDVKKELTSEAAEILYKIIQEALTNTIRHGKATKIIIQIAEEGDYIAFSIEDNGIGATDIELGFGLKGMQEAVEMVVGEIDFESENGFKIIGKLPLGVRVYD